MSDSFYARVKSVEERSEEEIRAESEYWEEHPTTGDDRKSGLV